MYHLKGRVFMPYPFLLGGESMAICPKCKSVFSENVIPMHIKRCSVVEEVQEHIEKEIKGLTDKLEVSEDEIRVKAKELGIKSWHVKSVDRLKEEISGVM